MCLKGQRPGEEELEDELDRVDSVWVLCVV